MRSHLGHPYPKYPEFPLRTIKVHALKPWTTVEERDHNYGVLRRASVFLDLCIINETNPLVYKDWYMVYPNAKQMCEDLIKIGFVAELVEDKDIL